MTDNEKRAHDLAIVMIPKIVEMREQEAVNETLDSLDSSQLNNGDKIAAPPVNVFEIYKELYEDSLNGFNRYFPDGE